MTSQRLCFSRARWPMASKFCSRATSKSLLFHRNHMLGTLDFTRSEHWAPFIIFLRAQPCRLSVQILCKARKTGQSRGCYKNHTVEPLHNGHQKSMYGLFVHGDKRNGHCREEFTPTCDRYIQERENFLLTYITISSSSNQVCVRLRL